MSSLKTCVVISAELITEIGKVLKDKKLQFSEILGLAPELMKIPKFVSNIEDAIIELKNGVAPETLKDINLAVATKLDIQNDKAELVTEHCINWLILTTSTVYQIVKVLK